jgi:energy-coupling factor transport system substrate-specific component
VRPEAIIVTAVLTVLAIGLLIVEWGGRDVRRLALVAGLAAAATAGRVVFAAIPSVKPVTVIVLVTGAVLGARAGFAVGALTPLLSNMVLGQGAWTPGQMALWGAAGLVGAALAPLCRSRSGLAAVGFVWGWVFGWGMNLWELATFGPEVDVDTWLARAGTSAWFDAAHAVGNIVFALTVGPPLVRLLTRYRNRIDVTIDWDRAPLPAP